MRLLATAEPGIIGVSDTIRHDGRNKSWTIFSLSQPLALACRLKQKACSWCRNHSFSTPKRGFRLEDAADAPRAHRQGYVCDRGRGASPGKSVARGNARHAAAFLADDSDESRPDGDDRDRRAHD